MSSMPVDALEAIVASAAEAELSDGNVLVTARAGDEGNDPIVSSIVPEDLSRTTVARTLSLEEIRDNVAESSVLEFIFDLSLLVPRLSRLSL